VLASNTIAAIHLIGENKLVLVDRIMVTR
jgi:hypothetical protein